MKPSLFSPSKKQSNAGFTLIEVMVSLTVLAVLAGLAAPGFSDSVKNYRVRSIRDDLTGSIQLARAEAIRRGESVSLRRTTGCGVTLIDTNDWSCGWTIFVDRNANGVRNANVNPLLDDTLLQTSVVTPGYGVMHPGSGVSLTVNVWGQAPAAFGRFVLTPPEGVSGVATTTVCINSGGRVRSLKNSVICP